MLKSNRSERARVERDHRPATRFWHSLGTLALAFVLVLVPSFEARGASAQRAIENLERCSQQERASGCVKILKRESAGKGRQRVKAQVRGGRIIWYEFDQKTGRVKRAN